MMKLFHERLELWVILAWKARSLCMGMSLLMCAWLTEGRFYRLTKCTIHLELFIQTIKKERKKNNPTVSKRGFTWNALFRLYSKLSFTVSSCFQMGKDVESDLIWSCMTHIQCISLSLQSTLIQISNRSLIHSDTAMKYTDLKNNQDVINTRPWRRV